MSIGYHQLRCKSINLLYHIQRLPPLSFHSFITQIAEVLTKHRLVAA